MFYFYGRKTYWLLAEQGQVSIYARSVLRPECVPAILLSRYIGTFPVKQERLDVADRGHGQV